MKVGIYTLGCKVNTYESEFILDMFKNRGYEISSFDDECDIYIVNTCTVTNNSDKKDRKVINGIKGKGLCTVVCGCFVENPGNYDFNGIDIVIGNTHKSEIVSLVENFLENKKHIHLTDNIMLSSFEDMEITHFNDRTRAFVKIQDGCENYCAYCVIPFVRGRQRSKDKDKVMEEITNLVKNGYKEIVLTGIHTGSYGVDLGIRFTDLLKELLSIDGLKRLRISSIEITELDEEFLNLLKDKRLCNHLHIPLQSGSDNVLVSMNRKYNKAKYKEIVDKIRSIRPDISLTTDVIVGFPGETDEDFEECLNFIKEINFSKVHVFPYSKRTGTKASRMTNEVSPIVKKQRVKRLIELSDILEKEYYNKFKGQELEVLVEKVEGGIAYGHTSNYLYLSCEGDYKNNEFYMFKVK